MTDAASRIRETNAANDVVLYMKGTKTMPQCGFSSRVAGVLNYMGVQYRDVDVLADDAGGVRIHGFQITSVQVPPTDMPLTWYTRHGDVFAGVCLVLGLPIFGWALVHRRRSFAG